ncbi:MAG: TIGR00725 family protein [Candidatus Daviesbacteria bacterium]|nr:TIGR00725 family protein [Candidatus Daviesbacteria bacterium]
MNKRKFQIAVIGSAGKEEYLKIKPKSKLYRFAEEIGELIAKKGSILVCGGKGGIMDRACKGAKKFKGITVGVVSGKERGTANKYVDVEIVSGMVNSSEEALIITMADAVIILGGGSGTLEEIALSYRNNKPMVAITGFGGWGDKLANTYLDERERILILSARTSNEAIDIVFNKLLSSGDSKP